MIYLPFQPPPPAWAGSHLPQQWSLLGSLSPHALHLRSDSCVKSRDPPWWSLRRLCFPSCPTSLAWLPQPSTQLSEITKAKPLLLPIASPCRPQRHLSMQIPTPPPIPNQCISLPCIKKSCMHHPMPLWKGVAGHTQMSLLLSEFRMNRFTQCVLSF